MTSCDSSSLRSYDASGELGSRCTLLQPGCPMCTPQLLLLTVVVLILPDAARPQPTSPAQALPTSSALGPVTPEVATAAPPDWSEGPTPGTPSVPENTTTDSSPGDAAGYGMEILVSQI